MVASRQHTGFSRQRPGISPCKKHADPRIFAIPDSCSRVAENNPNLEKLFSSHPLGLLGRDLGTGVNWTMSAVFKDTQRRFDFDVCRVFRRV